MKPQIIVDYNKAKGAVDLSDQMAAYSSPLRKSVKWYKKLGIDLILNTAMINALTLCKSVTKNKIQIVDFRRFIMMKLCEVQQNAAPIDRPKRIKHTLDKKEGLARKVRRTCRQCYAENVPIMGSRQAKTKTKKVSTYCGSCPTQPYLCLPCFNKMHL